MCMNLTVYNNRVLSCTMWCWLFDVEQNREGRSFIEVTFESVGGTLQCDHSVESYW